MILMFCFDLKVATLIIPEETVFAGSLYDLKPNKIPKIENSISSVVIEILS